MKKTVLLVICFIGIFWFSVSAIAQAPKDMPGGIIISSPANGTAVAPGQTITMNVINGKNFQAHHGGVMSYFFNQLFNGLPASFDITIPKDAIGNITLGVIAAGDDKGIPDTSAAATVIYPVALNATLQSITADPDSISFMANWNGNIVGPSNAAVGEIDGVFSDGVTRDISEQGMAFSSSDPTVVSVDNGGNITAYKAGPANITVTNSGISTTIPVTFEYPSGIRPTQTTPPTISMDIQPKPNTAGWYDSNITITLTAQASEASKGIRDITYCFPRINSETTFVKDNQAVVYFSEEGVNIFDYGADDLEGNGTNSNRISIQLDKTPPVITFSLLPVTAKPPKGREKEFPLPNFAKLSYSATDVLSGVKNTTAGLELPDISSFKTKLITQNDLIITINEKKKTLTIRASDPKKVLEQLKTGIYLIANNGIVHVNSCPERNKLRIIQLDGFLAIKAPAVTFKAISTDIAGNTAVKELPYVKINHDKVDDENDDD